ncbi:MAG TPA: ferritin-like domain-containing protein, partial [Kofleriaceae bacterium]|nr:ferritin-like domain-containing protein [Kofleriaceae bacterium]
FTQWVSVWFFEETRHPQVLLRWLHRLGVRVDEPFLRRGRATAPFMKSRFGTLVANVISELVASTAYAGIYATTDEPVLAAIAKNLAGDEARHAASFFAYAERALARSRTPDVDRRDAIKVAYLWFQDSVRHPVNEFVARNGATPGMDVDELRDRVLHVIGALVGLPLDARTDLRAVLGDLGGTR